MIFPERFLTSSLRSSPFGDSVTRILSEALNAVDPGRAIKGVVTLDGDILRIANNAFDLKEIKRIFVLAIGFWGIKISESVKRHLHVFNLKVFFKLGFNQV